MRAAILLLCLLPLGSCSTFVTPRSIAASEATAETKERALALLEEAVSLANGYLASPERRSLPAGRYVHGAGGHLAYVTEERIWPIRIRNSLSGDLVILFGFRAQERDDGFVVGTRPPGEHPEIDHSMFRRTDGEWHGPESVAELILHETAHTIHGQGTVGYGNTLAYYAEAVFLLRTNYHSAERIPRAVGEEFLHHRRIEAARAAGDAALLRFHLEALEEHLAQEREHCTHGAAPD